MIVLNDWYVVYGRLQGRVKDDSRFEDDKEITTSRIIKFDYNEKIAVTESGTTYVLGEPNSEFINSTIHIFYLKDC